MGVGPTIPRNLAWRPGAVIQTELLAQGNGRVQLRLSDGTPLEARGYIDRPVGSQLQLQLKRLPGGWQLRPLPTGGNALLRLLRESLPHRLEMSALIRLLNDVSTTSEGWQRLWAALPNLSRLLDPQGLRTAFLRAGLQLERRLAQGRVDTQDLKAVLLGLLDDDDPRLRKLSEGLLQQLRSRQAEALLEPRHGLLTLPFRVDERAETMEFHWRGNGIPPAPAPGAGPPRPYDGGAALGRHNARSRLLGRTHRDRAAPATSQGPAARGPHGHRVPLPPHRLPPRNPAAMGGKPAAATAGPEGMNEDPPERPSRAVALRYDGEAPPRVVAKGEGRLAEAITALAREHGIPLREDPELVALLARLELEQAIPPELFQAVAEILAFVYRLETGINPDSDPAPPPPGAPPSGTPVGA